MNQQHINRRKWWLPLLATGVMGLWAISLTACTDHGQAGQDHNANTHDQAEQAEHNHHTGSDDTSELAFVGDPYPLDTCPVTGQPLDSMGGPVSYVHEGREIKFCCAGCDSTFEADPAKYLAEIDERIIAQQAEHYPLEVCLVSGEELGSMGEPVDYVWHNRLVRFCCAGCIGDFEQAAEAHVAKLDEAVIAQQGEDYPLEVCVVSNEPLDAWGEPIEVVVANRLVRTCCEGCVDDLHAHPAKVLAALDRGEPLEGGGHDHAHGHSDHDHGHQHDQEHEANRDHHHDHDH